MSYFYGWITRNNKCMRYSYCKKDMSVDEWSDIKFNEFLPNELNYLYSLQNPDIFDDNGVLRREITWNDDEIPLDLFRKRKQITDLEKVAGNLLMVKHITTTRDVNKRFCTISPFINGDGYRSVPERLAKGLVIMPGTISPSERKHYQRNHPHLHVVSNKKSWMAQDIWNEWSLMKMRIVCRAREILRQSKEFPHFNYVDQQPNHTSEETIDYVVPPLMDNNLFVRNYPAKSTLHSQPCDRHVGRTIQQKVYDNAFQLLKVQNRSRMKGMVIEKIRLPELRKYFAKWIEKSFMDLIRNHKHLQDSALDASGINYYSTHIYSLFNHIVSKKPEKMMKI